MQIYNLLKLNWKDKSKNNFAVQFRETGNGFGNAYILIKSVWLKCLHPYTLCALIAHFGKWLTGIWPLRVYWYYNVYCICYGTRTYDQIIYSVRYTALGLHFVYKCFKMSFLHILLYNRPIRLNCGTAVWWEAKRPVYDVLPPIIRNRRPVYDVLPFPSPLPTHRKKPVCPAVKPNWSMTH